MCKFRHQFEQDATIISALFSTKSQSNARDPKNHQTKKGNQWHIVRYAHSAVRNYNVANVCVVAAPSGIKEYIGVNSKSRLIHSVDTTPANVLEK